VVDATGPSPRVVLDETRRDITTWSRGRMEFLRISLGDQRSATPISRRGASGISATCATVVDQVMPAAEAAAVVTLAVEIASEEASARHRDR
jgi:hypothetical protein